MYVPCRSRAPRLHDLIGAEAKHGEDADEVRDRADENLYVRRANRSMKGAQIGGGDDEKRAAHAKACDVASAVTPDMVAGLVEIQSRRGCRVRSGRRSRDTKQTRPMQVDCQQRQRQSPGP